MERRDFLKKSAIAMAAATIAPTVLSAKAGENPAFTAAATDTVSDFSITSNTVKDGIRHITAVPSAKVCSKQIDIDIDTKTNTIKNCAFTRGCPGNAYGLCKLLQGMKVSDVIAKLSGTPCASRGTSCPDQLARVLKTLK